MNFNTPFSEAYLLSNNPIPVEFENNRTIVITIPTLLETFNNKNINLFCKILNNELNIKELNLPFESNSSLGLILGLLKMNLFKEVTDILFKYVSGINYDTRLIINDKPITQEEFDIIKNIFLIGCGFLEYYDIFNQEKEIDKEKDDFSELLKTRLKKYNDKVKKIKKTKEKSISLQTSMIGIAYYFKYNFNQIFNLTPYSYLVLSN